MVPIVYICFAYDKSLGSHALSKKGLGLGHLSEEAGGQGVATNSEVKDQSDIMVNYEELSLLGILSLPKNTDFDKHNFY